MPLTWRREEGNRRGLHNFDSSQRPIGGYAGGIRFFVIYPSSVGPPEHRFYMTSLIKRPRDPGCTFSARATAEELMALAEQAFQDWLRRAQLQGVTFCH